MTINSLLLAFSIFLQPAAPPIVLDGSFDDWDDIAPSVVDAADAPASHVDFRSVRVTHDHEYVYLHVDFGNVVNVQALNGRAVLLLDVDGSARSGRAMFGMQGVDIALELTPVNDRHADRPGRGVGLQSATYQHDPNNPASRPLSVYDIGFGKAPTYASREYEFRIERGSRLPRTPVLFQGRQFSGKFIFMNVAGDVLDATDTFEHELTPVEPRQLAQETDPIARHAETDLRVISWNAEHGSLVPNPDPFARVLRALDPDIVLWQELTDQNSGEQIAAWFNHHLGGRGGDAAARWRVAFGEGGGNLRTAVASRHPIESVRQVALLPYRDTPDRHVRVIGAAVTIKGRRLLIVSAHLKCCGAIDTREDRLRFVEVRMINNAIRDALAEGDYDGVIIGGDLNLVGERNPKVVLSQSLDKGAPLSVVDAMQLNGRTNATWSERGAPFAPGRLDYLLYSRSSLNLRGSFVFEASDLTPRWLTHHGLLVSDTLTASDHFPIVADLSWRDE